MFNLDHAITEWRRHMAAGLPNEKALDELESHLREEIARQTKSGIETQAAFDAAVARLGNVDQLKSEFENVPRPRRWWQANLIASPKFERKMAEFLMLGSGLFVTGGMSFCILFKRGSCAELSPSQQAAALTAALLIGLVVAFGKYLHPFLPVLATPRTRITVIFTGMLLILAEFCVLFWGILPRATFTMSQLIVVLLWAMVPWGVSVGIAAGLHEASRRATRQVSQS